MPDENIYAPPTAIADPQERNKTTYLEQDGYSERGMLLCNEHFKTPNNCLKSGELLDTPEPPISRCVSRYLPSFKDSSVVKKAWGLRILLLLSYPLFTKNLFLILLYLTILLIAHHLLNYFSSEKIILKVHLNKSVLRTRKNSQILLIIVSALCAVAYVYHLINFSTKERLIISLAALLITTRFTISFSNLLRFNKKKGDFYYLRGAHPHFLAALPLRRLDD